MSDREHRRCCEDGDMSAKIGTGPKKRAHLEATKPRSGAGHVIRSRISKSSQKLRTGGKLAYSDLLTKLVVFSSAGIESLMFFALGL